MTATAPRTGQGWAIRTPRPADQGYITSTWLHSMQRAPAYRAIPRSKFFREMGRTIDRLLDRRDVAVLVACDGEQPDVIAGWVCYTELASACGGVLVHYLYVRRTLGDVILRGSGIGTALFRAAAGDPVSVAHTMHAPDERFLSHVAEPKVIYYPVEDFLS